MTNGIKFDLKKIYAGANDVVREQEVQAFDLLWNRITEKAKVDAQYRDLLTSDPKSAVEQEARSLQDASGKKVTVKAGVVEAIQKKAIETYSTAVPEVEAKKVEQLIFGTIEDIRRSFRVTLLLSQVLFYAGLVMVVAAFVVGLLGGEKMLTLLFGAGGIAGVLISSLVTGPMNRVQTAASDLVQLQMAYLAYYKQLYLLGGAGKPLPREDAVLYAHEIDRAARSLIGAIQKCIEKDKEIAGVSPIPTDSEKLKETEVPEKTPSK